MPIEYLPEAEVSDVDAVTLFVRQYEIVAAYALDRWRTDPSVASWRCAHAAMRRLDIAQFAVSDEACGELSQSTGSKTT